ncbi:hypothetical protein M9H77_16906 [Catharanthus roseus]|uniref:Uncharacterized protein n=1 Tax=Catharanthus roseus TaxID=4058 RepID=A0ACC0B338_CATRO|nr:hypothetical protein M9H77_16906 [Catharanthus roseus]
MVWPGARRGDDDLGPVIDKTGRVEGRVVTTSSCGVRGCPNTSEILSTPAPLGPGIYHELGAPRSSNQQPPILFRTHPSTTSHHLWTPISYDYYGHSQPPLTSYDPYIPLNEVSGPRLQLGASPEKSRPPKNPTQRKKAKNDGWEQTGPADKGPQDPVLVPSYSGHIAGSIWRRHERGILKPKSRYVSLIGWTLGDPGLALVVESPGSGLSTRQRVVCYVLYLLGNTIPGKLWLLMKNVHSIGGFAWGAATLAYLSWSLG